MTLRNLLSKGTFGAQMVDLGLPQIVQSLKAQAWSDEVRKLKGSVITFEVDSSHKFWMELTEGIWSGACSFSV